MLWTTKYAPKSFDEIVGNTCVVETFDKFLKSGNFPNLLISGPHGCGKATIAKLFVSAYLTRYEGVAHLKVYGSLHRDRSIVSESVDHKKTNNSGPNIVQFIKRTLYLPSHLYRVITIYDFDCLDKESQMSLRRTMEIYNNRARFILLTNQSNKVIEAIQSRVMAFKLDSISDQLVTSRLQEIWKQENGDIIDDVIHSIVVASNGDLRMAINYAQIFFVYPDSSEIPSVRTIEKILAMPKMRALSEIYELVESGYELFDLVYLVISVLSQSPGMRERIERAIYCLCQLEQRYHPVYIYDLILTI